MSAPCWIERREADPRYDYTEDTFDPTAPWWSPNCGHEVCLKEDALHEATDQRECTDPTQSGWGCPMAECRWDTARAMCNIEEGHEGMHEFETPNEIVLVFPDVAPAPEPRRAEGAS